MSGSEPEEPVEMMGPDGGGAGGGAGPPVPGWLLAAASKGYVTVVAVLLPLGEGTAVPLVEGPENNWRFGLVAGLSLRPRWSEAPGLLAATLPGRSHQALQVCWWGYKPRGTNCLNCWGSRDGVQARDGIDSCAAALRRRRGDVQRLCRGWRPRRGQHHRLLRRNCSSKKR